MPDHRLTGGRRRGLLGLLALLLAFGGWLGYTVATGEPAAPDDQTPAASSPSPTDDVENESPNVEDSQTEQVDAAAIRQCAEAIRVRAALAQAAGSGVEHWSVHIRARTDMLAGRITEERMKELWKESRLAGPDDLTKFDAAARKLREAPRCSGIRSLASPVGRPAKCQQQFRAAREAAQAAKAVIRDWRGHQENMAAFADGGMTAAQAQAEWVTAWKAAPPRIRAYRAASKALADSPRCRMHA